MSSGSADMLKMCCLCLMVVICITETRCKIRFHVLDIRKILELPSVLLFCFWQVANHLMSLNGAQVEQTQFTKNTAHHLQQKPSTSSLNSSSQNKSELLCGTRISTNAAGQTSTAWLERSVGIKNNAVGVTSLPQWTFTALMLTILAINHLFPLTCVGRGFTARSTISFAS